MVVHDSITASALSEGEVESFKQYLDFKPVKEIL